LAVKQDSTEEPGAIMSISRQEVEKVALLARLQLTDKEVELMTEQLSQIVEYIDQLGELDTEGVEPMAHAVELFNVFSDDEPRKSLDREEALANAPKRDEECFRVPAMLGD
jgi:aspartyl-tRNA(Asn)/glutamyl-tRNA(Gln) amidotransferase subunit C